jgi:methylmalonyl-CoA/ethylmalonyl-CoA epimerase
MNNEDMQIGETPVEFVQIGIVVKDLDRTVKALSEIFGLGPFQMITYPPAECEDAQLTFRGKPANFSHRLAFARLGSIELEIVQPLTGESGLTEFLNEHGEGIQHIRFNVKELQPLLNYLTEKGIQPLMSGSGLRQGTHWVHLDTAEKIGFTIEVMNVLPDTDGRTPQIVNGKVETSG